MLLYFLFKKKKNEQRFILNTYFKQILKFIRFLLKKSNIYTKYIYILYTKAIRGAKTATKEISTDG